jgi:N-sulfoglucosamine sulfohydrolase
MQKTIRTQALDFPARKSVFYLKKRTTPASHRSHSFLLTLFFALILTAPFVSPAVAQADLPLPNILWITSEDNSPFLGCYGDSLATTPHLDRLAARGFRYTHAYANAPVCAPSRNTILTGVYASAAGQENMRSAYRKSDVVKLYPEYLREAGYYCTNNQKEDFNIHPSQTQNLWNELGKEAHYKNRPAGKPFFAIFNSTITHESSIHTTVPDARLRHRPESVVLPPYHPDTPEMRHDWAQYYDKVEDMDTWVGGILKELEESGQAENTIIFYYGDHGGVLGRSKRYLYESGTRVPFIVYIPEKYRHLYPAEAPGQPVNRMVGFVDLVPTLLSLINVKIPDYLQGNAFLGRQKTADPNYLYMFRARMDERYDLSRAVRDAQFRYIRNYIPYRIYGQHIEYLFRAPSLQSWKKACETGNCDAYQQKFWQPKPPEELYDTKNDPWEIHNLAEDPKFRAVLERLRQANQTHLLTIADAGFIPEATLASIDKTQPIYDYMRSGRQDRNALLEAAEYASSHEADPRKLARLLKSSDPSVRYWAASGFRILGNNAQPYRKQLKKAASDPSESVAIVAAETLYLLNLEKEGRQALINVLASPHTSTRTQALNVVDYAGDDSDEIKQAVLAMVRRVGHYQPDKYDLRMARTLLRKWNIHEESLQRSVD